MTHPSHNHHANNFVDTAHYVPLTGEIRASKIQGEARMDDRRYRKMCFPDGRYVWGDFS